MTRTVIVLALLAAGCGGKDLPDWPHVETLAAERGESPCADPWATEELAPGEMTCWWREVLYGNRPTCWAAAHYVDDGGTWERTTIVASDATCWD